MLLEPQDLQVFFRLHRTLMFFVNQRRKVLPGVIDTPEEFASQSPSDRLQVRAALLANSSLLDEFVSENPARMPDDELEIVHSWRHQVFGKFFIFRELKKHTVFLSTDHQPIAYGVLALSQPFEDLVGPNLPVLVETVLLPFKGTIVYDGLIISQRITFGASIRRSLNESFKEAKARDGIIVSLPVSSLPISSQPPRSKLSTQSTRTGNCDATLRTVIDLIEKFCHERLNQEYAAMCRKLAEKLGRKRPSPLARGTPSTWASGIVRAIGSVNFLSDKTQTPHMRLADVDAYFGVSESGAAAKLAVIRKLFQLGALDPEWTLPSRLADNPLVWMLQVNGIMLDVRHAPREVQEIAFQKGLIPYIPADRPK